MSLLRRLMNRNMSLYDQLDTLAVCGIAPREGIGPADGSLGPVQEAFRQAHGLQCGFCTPGFVISVHAFLEENPHPSLDEIREGLSGNLCRCTGYQGIIKAVQIAAESMSAPAS